MIKIKEKKNKKDQKPYYQLKIDYMIGDADGSSEETGTYTLDHAEGLERFCRTLDKMQPPSGRWGIILDQEHYDEMEMEGILTQDDVDFMVAVTSWDNDEYIGENGIDEEDPERAKRLREYSKKYPNFEDMILNEGEYMFYIYEGYTLKYVDEKGVKHNTYFED